MLCLLLHARKPTILWGVRVVSFETPKQERETNIHLKTSTPKNLGTSIGVPYYSY